LNELILDRRESMKIQYDPKHDLLNIEFLPDEPISESSETDGLIIDYTKDGRMVAIEILDVGKRTTKNPLDLLDLSIVKEKTPV
jgi:uncharacterized protein YuzE